MSGTTAFLRNGAAVVLTGRSETEEFPIMGRVNGCGDLELWRRDGRYREDGAEHPRDITQIKTPCGKIVPFLGLAPS
jgi:hypothetical protein